MSKEIKEDIRPALKKAIINYNIKHGGKFTQADIEPRVDQSHVNNVAAGRSVNSELRTKIQKFIKKWGSVE